MIHFNNRYLKYVMLFVSALIAVSMAAQSDDMSVSKRINKIKRDGAYIYAEATASTEAEAKSICDDIIKVEISKYVASKKNLSNADQVIIKDARYEQQYLSMPRGDMVRVFIYVRKSDIEGGNNASILSSGLVNEINEAQDRARELAAERAAAQESTPTVQETAPEPTPVVSEAAPRPALVSTGTSLSKWQKEMLADIAASKDMADAKNKLNRYKAQYKVKRIGDNTTAPKGPSVLCYAVYGDGAILEALLAPGDNSPFIDMISGDSSDISRYPGKKYLWFTLSK